MFHTFTTIDNVTTCNTLSDTCLPCYLISVIVAHFCYHCCLFFVLLLFNLVLPPLLHVGMGGVSFQVFKFFQIRGRSLFLFLFYIYVLDVNHLFVVCKVYFSYIALFFSYIIFCTLHLFCMMKKGHKSGLFFHCKCL
jgi:hypothetical protein